MAAGWLAGDVWSSIAEGGSLLIGGRGGGVGALGVTIIGSSGKVTSSSRILFCGLVSLCFGAAAFVETNCTLELMWSTVALMRLRALLDVLANSVMVAVATEVAAAMALKSRSLGPMLLFFGQYTTGVALG